MPRYSRPFAAVKRTSARVYPAEALVVYKARRTALVSPLRLALGSPPRPVYATRRARKLTLTALLEISAGLLQGASRCGPTLRTSSCGSARARASVHPARGATQQPEVTTEAPAKTRRVSFAAELERVRVFDKWECPRSAWFDDAHAALAVF